jgi:hypothetical protein
VGLIQLGINSSNNSVAIDTAKAAVKFPEAHAPEVARKMLQTAATRGNLLVVQTLVSCHPMQQCLDAATVEGMLVQLIKGDNPYGYVSFQRVCDLPAALQLDSAAAARLLQAALKRGRPDYVERLLELPAAEQLSGDMVSPVLHTLVDYGATQPDRIVKQLCLHKGAWRLSSSALYQLLFAAIQQDNGSDTRCMQELARLPDVMPPAEHLDSNSVERLLVAALKASSDCAHWICQLPGAWQLDIAALEPLIEAAVLKLSDPPKLGLRSLMRLPAAAQLSCDTVIRLLRFAITCGAGHSFAPMLGHPVAEQLTPDMVVELLQTALTHNPKPCFVIWLLCALPAADQIGADVLA